MQKLKRDRYVSKLNEILKKSFEFHLKKTEIYKE